MKFAKTVILATAIVAMLFGTVACSPKGSEIPGGDTGDNSAFDSAAEALDGYLGAFGHVRVLGDIDHLLKGEDVDGTMKLTTPVSFNETKTEFTIPLTLTKYDFDGHKNPEDPEPEKYTRLADGTLTLVLKGAMNAEGSGFVATGYEFKDVDVTLSCDTSTYILLDLPTVKVKADILTGIFTTKGGVARSSVVVTMAEGKAAGIANLNDPKFGTPDGEISASL